MGYIAMKGLAGGLLTNTRACFAYMAQFDNVIPIWGIQRDSELEAWLRFMDEPAAMDDELRRFIEADKQSMDGDFCRGCGYCMPCTQGIAISSCARMSLMARRAPSLLWKGEHWQKEMEKIETCIDCGVCKTRCPYQLDIPNLLRRNLADYREIIAGETGAE